MGKLHMNRLKASGTIHKIRPLYESLYGQKWRKWKLFLAKIPHNSPYRTCMRVIMEIFSGRNFTFSSFLFVQTFKKWSYFVDDPLGVSYTSLSCNPGWTRRTLSPMYLFFTFMHSKIHLKQWTSVENEHLWNWLDLCTRSMFQKSAFPWKCAVLGRVLDVRYMYLTLFNCHHLQLPRTTCGYLNDTFFWTSVRRFLDIC